MRVLSEGVVLTLTRVPGGTDDAQGVQSASGDGVMELVTVTKYSKRQK